MATNALRPADTTTERMETLQRLATHFPKCSPAELTTLADWVMTGGTTIDPTGLERATQKLASDRGEDFPTSSTRGIATAMVLAYLGR